MSGDDLLSGAVAAPKLAAPAPAPAEAAAWYVAHLGFPDSAVYADGDYAVVRRGDFVLHFWRCPDRRIAENTACYLTLRDVPALDALYAELAERAGADGFAPGRLRGAPQDFPGHGMREFHLSDPAGNLISFGARLG